jgi:hypothetical protein
MTQSTVRLRAKIKRQKSPHLTWFQPQTTINYTTDEWWSGGRFRPLCATILRLDVQEILITDRLAISVDMSSHIYAIAIVISKDTPYLLF